jgi:hypothetical protein
MSEVKSISNSLAISSWSENLVPLSLVIVHIGNFSSLALLIIACDTTSASLLLTGVTQTS